MTRPTCGTCGTTHSPSASCARTTVLDVELKRLRKSAADLEGFINSIRFEQDRQRLLELRKKGWRVSGVTMTDGNQLEHFAVIP